MASPPGDPARLPDLAVGTSAYIHGIAESAPEHVAVRLRHLGFRPGNRVQMVRIAPLGDPQVYRILGYEMCLRRHEARHIQVAQIGPSA